MRLRNKDTTSGGQMIFAANVNAAYGDEIDLDLPANGDPVTFGVAGKFDQATGDGFPSTADKDAIISVTDQTTDAEITSHPLMVRVRKNADDLTEGERDRFLSALVTLNQSGNFVEFQNMHVNNTSLEIHQRSCFLPWHRAYLLDLERNLQSIDPSVALPYWRFDEAAPNVFNLDFMGLPDVTGLVEFSATNPLRNWKLSIFGEGTGQGVRRRNQASFNPATSPAVFVQNDENATLAFGTRFQDFDAIEGDPHGSAHVSFAGQISNIGRAPADPLFFMLHCNVDRLWAKWQWLIGDSSGNALFDPTSSDAYPRQGNGNPAAGGEGGIGNFTDDTMWPWNGISGAPRPATAPGGPFPLSLIASQPGTTPVVADTIDFHGQDQLSRSLGFAYDDVPYDLPAPAPIVV